MKALVWFVPVPPALFLATALAGSPGTTDPEDPAPVTWIDLDLDGRQEILILHPNGRAALIREAGDGLFEDCTTELGLGALPLLARAFWPDVDGDGDPDLIAIGRDGSGALMINEGSLGFRDETLGSGLDLSSGVVGASWHESPNGQRDLWIVSAAGAVGYRHIDGPHFERLAVAALEHAAGAPLGSAPVPHDSAQAPVRGADPEKPAGPDTPEATPGSAERLALVGSATASATPEAAMTTTANPLCAASVEDQSAAGCLQASSIPGLGMLYPISSDLYVDAGTGRVGINTVSPAARLHVDGGNGTGLAVSSSFAGDSLVNLQSPNTNPLKPTLFSKVGAGGVSGYFQERLQVGTLFAGLPSPRASIGLSNNGGELRLNGTVETVELLAYEAAGNGAQLDLRTAGGVSTITLDAEAGSSAAEVSMFDKAGLETVQIRSQSSITGQGGQLALRRGTGTNTVVVESDTARGAELSMRNPAGLETFEVITEETGGGAQLTLFRQAGFPTIVLDAEAGSASQVSMYNSNAIETIEMVAEEASGNGSQIILKKYDGTVGIVLDAEQGTDSRITTDTLQITGGADLVEGFAATAECEPGSVVVIDRAGSGTLGLSSTAYDPRVAGVVSGAGGVKPGIRLGQQGVLDGETPIALSGRIYALCTDENGPISPGDLLTSSSTPGHAMRATDPERSFGAVIGKAMGRLEGERGLVLVLVGLQ